MTSPSTIMGRQDRPAAEISLGIRAQTRALTADVAAISRTRWN